MSLGVCYFMPKQRRQADVELPSDVATCIKKKLNSQVNIYSLIYYSLQPFVVGAAVCLSFAKDEVKLIVQVFRAS